MLGFILSTTVLISRPKKDAEVLRRAILSRYSSTQIVLAPAIVIASVAYKAQSEICDAIILTSKHAVQAAVDIGPDTLILCVGDTTADAARKSGLNAVSAGGTSKDLIALVKKLNLSKVLYLRGLHVHADISFELISAGIETKSVVVYEQTACIFPSEIAHKIAKATDLLVPVYSTRSANIVSKNLEGFDGAIILVAISKAAAEGWSGPKPHKTIYADAPNSEAMLTAIASQLV